MSIRNIYTAETWEKVYTAFQNVNFTAFDYDTIKESLLQYVRLYYREQYNDFIESSEFIALIESFAYVAEQLSYRIDMLSHENFISTAQRKQSILKLAKLISYKITRNIPARGLVKINAISSTEKIIDSQGNNLAGLTISWNDPNNPNWKEQFFLVMNRVMTGKFGQPSKAFQVGDVAMQLYTFNNNPTSFTNGVLNFTVNTGIESFPMEVVPIDINGNGPFERSPDINSQMSLVFALDGIGDGSDYTGFLMFIKQGTLTRTEYSFDTPIPNRTLLIAQNNINETDVWLNRVDNAGNVIEKWEAVDSISEQNLMFNTVKNRKKFEIETLENDNISLIFGDGDFSDIPSDRFYIWTRQSLNKSVVIQKNKLVNHPMGFTYTSSLGLAETCSLTFSSTSTIQNSSASETIEHVRQSAPATYYAQNRMVNAQDYNTFMLKDPSILRVNAVNRTFAGQPKYIDWNDASGSYENIKLFGDDLTLHYDLKVNTMSSNVGSRSMIDSVLEPLLSTTGILNLLIHVSASDPSTQGVISSPRRKFIEDARTIYVGQPGSTLLEKTRIQGALDRHWYGEPLSYVTIGSVTAAKIPDPLVVLTDDSRIYPDAVPRTVDGINLYPPGDIGSGLQPIAAQPKFGLKYNRTSPTIGNATITGTVIVNAAEAEVLTIEVATDNTTLYVTSNVRGALPVGTIGIQYSNINTSTPIDFMVTQGVTALSQGDAFIVRIPDAALGAFGTAGITTSSFNLNGYWSIINGVDLETNPALPYDPNDLSKSWIIWVETLTNGLGDITGFNVNYRELKLVCESNNTKFWYNSSTQILDSETRKRVHDRIRILRSNLAADDLPLGHNENYDVVGAIKDNDGIIKIHELELIPSDALDLPQSGDTMPDNLLQYEIFAKNKYKYYSSSVEVIPTQEQFDTPSAGWSTITFVGPIVVQFAPGSFIDTTETYTRTLIRSDLDFMWQHFSPYTNIIDPSVSNIHDIFLITRGYYDNVSSFLRGTSTIVPVPPTPLELRNSYGYLLQNKMLSDTVVLHSGKVKLLFGDLAEPQLRAKFKIIRSNTATLTNERIKFEVLDVINTYFSIDNWDFGATFYATELIGLIHQRIPLEVASVVLVPQYSINSFGSLFTVLSGFDEILQSAAKITDLEIVDSFTPTILRQNVS